LDRNDSKFETISNQYIIIKMGVRTFVRASLNGIVYLIDAQSGRVYTYNPESPVYIGDLERIAGEELATTEGNLTGAKLNLKPGWEQAMTGLLDK
jgi:hypothetical protein